MKIFLYFFITLLFHGCGNPKPQSYPQWYKNKEIHSTLKYEIIGYGEGRTIKEAEALAKENIAQTLISKVNSSFSMIKTTKIDNKQSNYNKNSKSKLIVTSKLNLQNLKTLKQEMNDGVFYVALQYQNLDLAHRIKTVIGHPKCIEQSTNTYLSKTPLIQKLNASLSCELDFKLDRRNESWYLNYKEHLFLLSNDEFEELFTSINNSDDFEFLASKKILLDGDNFYFTFNAKTDGYITLLNVYENGIVTLLQPSIPTKNTLQIPSKDSSNYFEAGLVKDGTDTYDLYVAIFTKQPLDTSRFEYASEELAESELAYKFDELIRVINTYKYSSLLLRTRAK